MDCPYKIGDIVRIYPQNNEDPYEILVLTEPHRNDFYKQDVWVVDCILLETGETEYDFPILTDTDKVIA